MKSLALHLLAILLLGSMHIATHSQLMPLAVATASASAKVAQVASTSAEEATTRAPMTTLQLPSLRAPQHAPSTTTTKMTTTRAPKTAAITTSTKTTTATVLRLPAASAQPQQPAARRASLAHAETMTKTSGLASTSLVRAAEGSSKPSNVRQNRSLQSASVRALLLQNDNSSNSNRNSSNNIYTYQRAQRRWPSTLRTNQQDGISTTPTWPSSSSSPQRQSLPAFMANHRQSQRLNSDDKPAAHAQASQTTATDASKSQQTLKAPRMIQRLAAGHIQNAEGHSTYQVSAVTSNSSVSNTNSSSSNSDAPSPLYFRRKQPAHSSTFRYAATSTTPRNTATVTTTPKPYRLQSIDTYEDYDNDEALLDDADDFGNWDNGILRLSAGSGKETATKSKKGKDDSKKTLADQVRDGKYGLIEEELFRREPKRPGVISYLPNKEVPIDNERNYGGLDEEDIWLAEDHLLVIKGGSLNEGASHEPWPPIDDYDAPGRQIKIPPNPKVPPPFPVQLEEGGPIQFIGNNKFTVVYPVANESIPVYPTGPEANYPTSLGDGDDEKNLLTRPGSAQDVAEGEPGYVYPPAYPPWLFHNQTFVKPFQKNARPITFPGLGPFPFGRNGSLENSNDTDYFDEDDPSLYYPPAYSFVYKNNYTNHVPPGPLVPGIVLPPPANQFSRLNKPRKSTTTTTITPLPRHRVYTTTSTTTTTTTTTTSTTTTRPPFRQVVTKVHEYTPKTIIITPSPNLPSPVLTTPPPRLPPTPPPTPPTPALSPPQIVEPVPVPVAVPYPSHKFTTSRPNALPFVPTTPEPAIDTFSKSNPIYYEYFEAKRQPSTANAIDGFRSTTSRPSVSSQPIKVYANGKRPFKSQAHRNYLQPVPPQRQFVPENIVYITPKPETRYNAPIRVPVYQPRPLEDFESEVNAIRETLRYYQNQQLRDNSIPRAPKAKAVYEYSFDAAKNLEPVQPGSFQPPAEFDEEPFQPMVTYSPPVDDENAFRAIAFDKVDTEEQLPTQRQQQQLQPRYQSTTTLVPVEVELPYQESAARAKKQRLGAKYLQQQYQQQQQQQKQQEPQFDIEYESTPRSTHSTPPPWESPLRNQELREYELQSQQQQQPQPQQYQPERLQLPRNRIAPGGYYYRRPPVSGRLNNRFYDEPFQNPERKVINYRPQQPSHQQQQQQQSPIWSLENDTYVNFAPNRPPINPDAEFINPYQTPPVNSYAQQGQRFAPLPAFSHQSQFYEPPQRLPPPVRQQQQQIPLHRDVLVNYRPPLPPINPESEYISHAQVARNQPQQFYRPNMYRTAAPPEGALSPVFRDNGGDQANVFYITPKYRRANNNNNNNNNRNNNGNTEGNRKYENNGK